MGGSTNYTCINIYISVYPYLGGYLLIVTLPSSASQYPVHARTHTLRFPVNCVLIWWWVPSGTDGNELPKRSKNHRRVYICYTTSYILHSNTHAHTHEVATKFQSWMSMYPLAVAYILAVASHGQPWERAQINTST
jgi:hypothetical protein